jgi:hypothetical protein
VLSSRSQVGTEILADSLTIPSCFTPSVSYAAERDAMAANAGFTYQRCSLGDASNFMNLDMVTTTCPQLLPTIGAALGYAGYIEIALTSLIIAVMKSTGVLKKDGRHYRDLLEVGKKDQKAVAPA